MTYFNTNSEQGATLIASKENCKSQEAEILEHFQKIRCATASEIHYYMDEFPLTSIRRGITNLTKAGKLRKTGIQRIGIYGKMTYIYVLIREYRQTDMFQ